MQEGIISSRSSPAVPDREQKGTTGSESGTTLGVADQSVASDVPRVVPDHLPAHTLGASYSDPKCARSAAECVDSDCPAFDALLELPFLCGFVLEFLGAPEIYSTLAATCKRLRAAVLSSPHWALVASRRGLLSCLLFEPKGLLSERRSKGRVRVARLPAVLFRSVSSDSPSSLVWQCHRPGCRPECDPWRKVLFPGLYAGIPCLRVGLQPTPQAFLIGFKLLAKDPEAGTTFTPGSYHQEKSPRLAGLSGRGGEPDETGCLRKARQEGTRPGFRGRRHDHKTRDCCQCNSGVPLFGRVAVRSLDMSSANAEIDDGLPASVLRELALLQQVEDQRRGLRACPRRNFSFLEEKRASCERSVESDVSGESSKKAQGPLSLGRMKLPRQDLRQESFHEGASICGGLLDSLHAPHVVQFIGSHIAGKKLHLVTKYADGNLQDFWAVSNT